MVEIKTIIASEEKRTMKRQTHDVLNFYSEYDFNTHTAINAGVFFFLL